MKKFFAALTMLAVFMTASIAMAAFEENIEEGAKLSAVKRIAIAMPNYYKVENEEPHLNDLLREIGNVGKMTSTLQVVSYDDVASGIRRDTGIDILSLDVPEAEKVYNKYVSRYADAYVIATIANNSKVPEIFFYVYNANDQKLMYTYRYQSRLTGKRTRDYSKVVAEFFEQFDRATANSLEKEERKELKEKQKEIRAEKRKEKKKEEKTSKNKVDLVRKK